MITPTVTEIPRTLNAVGHDTFIDDAGDPAVQRRPWSRPAAAVTRSVAPVQAAAAGDVRRLPLAAQPPASDSAPSMTLTRAA